MTNNNKVLFLTNNDYGPASLVLAIAYELVVHGCEVHIASFNTNKELGPSLTNRVQDLNNGEYGALPKDSKPITLHLVDGQSVEQTYLTKKNIDLEGYTYIEACGARAASRNSKALLDIFDFENLAYLTGMKDLASVIKNIQPNVVAVDYLCAEARAAVTTLELRHYIILSHSSSKFIMTGADLRYQMWNFPP